MADKVVRVTGVGFAAPNQIRTNDAPVFEWIRTHNPSHADLFKGFDRRPVLAPDETLAGLMSAASKQALADARLDVQDVDLLIGVASVSDYVTPNALVQAHRDLGLPARCQALPIGAEFTTFNDSLVADRSVAI